MNSFRMEADMSWNLDRAVHELLQKEIGYNGDAALRYFLYDGPGRETPIDTKRETSVADLQLPNMTTISVRADGDQKEIGNSSIIPNKSREGRDPCRFEGDGRVLSTGDTEFRRSKRAKAAETTQKLKSLFHDDGKERENPFLNALRNETASARTKTRRTTKQHRDPNAFKGDGRVLESGEVVEGKKLKTVVDDSKDKEEAPSEELISIFLRRGMGNNLTSFMKQTGAITLDVLTNFMNKTDVQYYKEELKKSANEDEGRTAAEALHRGDYRIINVERAEELKVNECDDYGECKLSSSNEGTFWVTFEPIADNLSTNTKGVKKKATLFVDKTLIIERMEVTYTLLKKIDRLHFLHAHKFATHHPCLFWSIVRMYNFENNCQSKAATFRDMLQCVMPHINWSFVAQGDGEVERSRTLSVVGAESKKYLEYENEK